MPTGSPSRTSHNSPPHGAGPTCPPSVLGFREGSGPAPPSGSTQLSSGCHQGLGSRASSWSLGPLVPLLRNPLFCILCVLPALPLALAPTPSCPGCFGAQPSLPIQRSSHPEATWIQIRAWFLCLARQPGPASSTLDSWEGVQATRRRPVGGCPCASARPLDRCHLPQGLRGCPLP